MELFRDQVEQFGELNHSCATSGLLAAADRKSRIAKLLPESPPASFRPEADLERWAKRQVVRIGGQVVVDGKKLPRRPRLKALAERVLFGSLSLHPPSPGASAAPAAGSVPGARPAPFALSGGLTRLARFREEATALNRERYDKEIKRLALLFRRSAFLVILFLQFSEYQVDIATGGKQPGWVGGLQWMGFIAACALSAWTWRENRKKQRTRVDDWQNDTRALGEALRVQFYWTYSGTGESVASNYLQRARSEVSWIRAVVSNLVRTCGHDRFAFARAGLAAQVESLRRVRHGWILDQSAYFEGKVHEFHREKQYHHLRGNLLLAAGFGLVFLGFFTTENRFHGLASVLQPHDAWGWTAWLFALPVTMALAWLVSGWIDLKAWRAHRDHIDKLDQHRSSDAEKDGPDPWIKRVHGVHRVMHHWSAALVAGLGLAVTLFGVVSATQAMLVHHHLHILPDPEQFLVHCKWLLFTSGGLDHWWVANKFFAENLRRYSAMAGLFRGADDRLRSLLESLVGKTVSTNETRSAITEIQQIYVAVGREALNENADWLLMHRDKRLDPQLPAG